MPNEEPSVADSAELRRLVCPLACNLLYGEDREQPIEAGAEKRVDDPCALELEADVGTVGANEAARGQRRVSGRDGVAVDGEFGPGGGNGDAVEVELVYRAVEVAPGAEAGGLAQSKHAYVLGVAAYARRGAVVVGDGCRSPVAS